jgi:hypothetical protein
MSGHVFLLEQQMRELRAEMLAQGMACGAEGGRGIPLHKLETPKNWFVSVVELEEALEAASPEPSRVSDGRLWQDFLVFLAGASRRGGMRVK